MGMVVNGCVGARIDGCVGVQGDQNCTPNCSLALKSHSKLLVGAKRQHKIAWQMRRGTRWQMSGGARRWRLCMGVQQGQNCTQNCSATAQQP